MGIARNCNYQFICSICLNENNTLKHQLEKVVAKSIAQDTENNEVKRNFMEAMVKNNEIVTDLRKYKIENVRLEGNISDFSLENMELSAKNSELITENSELIAKNSELSIKSTQLIEKNSELSIKSTQLIEKNSELSIKSTQLIEKNSELFAKNSQLIIKNGELFEKNTELKIDNHSLQKRCAAYSTKLDGCRNALKLANRRNKRLNMSKKITPRKNWHELHRNSKCRISQRLFDEFSHFDTIARAELLQNIAKKSELIVVQPFDIYETALSAKIVF